MVLKKHHKIILGSFSTLVIVFMVVTAILLNGIIVNQRLEINKLNDKIDEYQSSTSNKINYLTKGLIQTKSSLYTLDDSITTEVNELKVSVTKDFSDIIEEVIKSVVTIRTDLSQGTGFIIEDTGYIVTNAHVLSDANFIKIVTYDQQIINAELIGYDDTFDVALLKIPGNYNSLKLMDSEETQIGDKVSEIGNPLSIQFSVKEGIISGIHRIGINGIDAYFQTDAALNPGNSGGPLINAQGKVVGINNFKISGGESIGFALESNYLKETINKIDPNIIN